MFWTSKNNWQLRNELVLFETFMKVLKETGSFLKEKAKGNGNIGAVLILFGMAGLVFAFFSSNFVVGCVSFILLGMGFFSFQRYLHYSSGYEGERKVVEQLIGLNDDYSLINDIKVPNSFGNIDHVLLSPNGIFVIETKNFEGKIRCDGDNWYQYKEHWKVSQEHEIKSPSKQAKGNALSVKNFLISKGVFDKPANVWVNAIVVFTSEKVDLSLNAPVVPILKLSELVSFIQRKRVQGVYSFQEIERAAKAILLKDDLV